MQLYQTPEIRSPQPSLHARLREATALARARLGQTMDLLRQPLSRTRFVGALQALHAFHRGWEPALAERLADDGFTAPRRRALLAAQDLRALGCDTGEPDCPGSAALCGDMDAALGSLYVMEGSTLGARVIDAHLREAAWPPGGGLRYFSDRGTRAVPMWRESLDRIERGATCSDRVIAGALLTFDVLDAQMRARLA